MTKEIETMSREPLPWIPMANPKTEAKKAELLAIAQSLVEIKSKVEGSSPQLDAEYERFFSKWVEILGVYVVPQDDEGD